MEEYIEREAVLDKLRKDKAEWESGAEPQTPKEKFIHGVVPKLIQDVIEFIEKFPTANGVVREWIPVTERLPEDGEVVLAYCNKGICTAEFRLYGECRHFHIVGYKNCTVTHWMPLPEPPMRKEENDG